MLSIESCEGPKGPRQSPGYRGPGREGEWKCNRYITKIVCAGKGRREIASSLSLLATFSDWRPEQERFNTCLHGDDEFRLPDIDFIIEDLLWGQAVRLFRL